MGIYEFNILSIEDKGYKTFNEGEFVDSVSKGTVKYVLYALDKFWVEVRYDAANNKITGISSFIGGEPLNRYSNVPDTL